MWMTHPTLPDQPAEVVESAFDDFWQHRGWVVCDPPSEPDEEDLGHHADPEAEPEPLPTNILQEEGVSHGASSVHR